MNVPEGFKQTEVGVIPQGWKILSLGKCADILTGFPFPSSGYSNDGFKLLRGSNVKRGVTDWSKENTKYWKNVTKDIKAYQLEAGDIVIAMDVSLVGKSFAQISEDDLPALLLQRVARIRTDYVDINYISHLVCGNYFTNYCEQIKTSSAIPHISPKDIKDFQIPLPPTRAEQTAIAAALSDMDALIEGVEKLLEKKRRIKQGAMQELLKPKEGWKEVQLDSVADIDNDNLSSSSDANFTFQYISLEDVDNGFLKGTTEMMFKDAPSRARRRVKQGDVLISTVRPNLKSHLLIKENLKNYICSTGFSLVRCYKEKLSSDYLFNHLFASYINRQIETVISGSNYPAINTSHIKSLKIPIPARIEEQEEIAAILSDMDSEIEQLETQLAKYRQLKTGMMQELLTGKKRLV